MSKFIYLHKSTGHYQVSKKIKGKCYSFGTYDTFEEALHVRDYFKKSNWPISERLKFSKNKFVHYYHGKYHVNKTINGKKTSFGVFDNFEDAEYQVELCKRFGWDLRLKPFNCMKHIRKRISSTGRVTYRVVRWTPKGEEFYGTFNKLSDAQFERDLLMLYNWDYDALESFDEGDEFLTGKANSNIRFYRPPNGRIDYGVI